jgi:hypothetical protein
MLNLVGNPSIQEPMEKQVMLYHDEYIMNYFNFVYKILKIFKILGLDNNWEIYQSGNHDNYDETEEESASIAPKTWVEIEYLLRTGIPPQQIIKILCEKIAVLPSSKQIQNR